LEQSGALLAHLGAFDGIAHALRGLLQQRGELLETVA